MFTSTDDVRPHCMRRCGLLCVAMLAIGACEKSSPNKSAKNTSAAATTAATGNTITTTARTTSSQDRGEESDARAVIDVHLHLGPDAYPEALRRLEPLGLQRLVNLSGGSSGRYMSYNLEKAQAMGEGRVLLFANLPWGLYREREDFPKLAAKLLRQAAAAGFAGLKISKGLGLGYVDNKGELLAVDDRRLDPIWEACAELGLPVAIHTGDPKAFWQKPGPDNERHAELSLRPGWGLFERDVPARKELLEQRDRLVARHPETRFILVHLGNNPEDIDYVDELLQKHANASVDIAARVGEFGRQDAARMRAFFTKHQDRVLFGTDLQLGFDEAGQARLTLGSVSEEPPRLSEIERFYQLHYDYFEGSEPAIEHPVPIQGDWKVHPVKLAKPVLEKIYYKNAERLIVAPHLGRRAAQRLGQRAGVVAVVESR